MGVTKLIELGTDEDGTVSAVDLLEFAQEVVDDNADARVHLYHMDLQYATEVSH